MGPLKTKDSIFRVRERGYDPMALPSASATVYLSPTLFRVLNEITGLAVRSIGPTTVPAALTTLHQHTNPTSNQCLPSTLSISVTVLDICVLPIGNSRPTTAGSLAAPCPSVFYYPRPFGRSPIGAVCERAAGLFALPGRPDKWTARPSDDDSRDCPGALGTAWY